MLRKLRSLCVVLAFSILAGQICIVNVNAAEGVTSKAEITELSELRITGIDRPVTGKNLPMKAMVRTRENISWEIPVIWIDDLGNTAYIAQEGRTYTPNFIFYVPQGYKIKDVGADGRFIVSIPDFLTEVFGEDSLIFAIDPVNGITYITFLPALQALAAGREKLPVVTPGNSSEVQSSSDAEAAEEEESATPYIPTPVTPDREVPDQVLLHCSPKVIDKVDRQTLEELVSLVKNKLEPQAVNLLINSFDAYSKAADQNNLELSKSLGLYIYYASETVEDDLDGDKMPSDALALIYGDYFDETFKYFMGINAYTVLYEDEEDGNWKFKEDATDDFCNTIVHEMMHAIMFDYTRTGMVTDDSYPVWFIEGSASAVENVYQYRHPSFRELGIVNEDGSVNYSTTSILEKYTDKTLTGDNIFDIETELRKPESYMFAYTSGYLAFVYLSYMAAAFEGEDAITVDDNGTVDDYSDDKITGIKMDYIRDGASRILELLHDGNSLDSVIAHYSSRGADDANPIYETTDDFTVKFIKGDNENTVTRTLFDKDLTDDKSPVIYGSLPFCMYYLNYLESQSTKDIVANGSILRDSMNYTSPLDPYKEEESNLYSLVLGEANSVLVASTVDNDNALKAGGKTNKDDSDDYDEQDPKILDISDYGTGGQIAARTQENVTENTAENVSSDTITDVISGESADINDNLPAENVLNDNSADVPAAVVDNIPTVPVDTYVENDNDAVTDTGIASIPESDLYNMISGNGSEISNNNDSDYSILPHEEDAIIPDENIYIDNTGSGNDDNDGGNDPGNSSGNNDSGSDPGNDGGNSDASGSESSETGDSAE